MCTKKYNFITNKGHSTPYRIAASDQYIAVTNQGMITILSLADLSNLYEHPYEVQTDSMDAWAYDIKFSPDGLNLGVTNMDGLVSVYTVNPSALNPPVEGEAAPVETSEWEEPVPFEGPKMLTLKCSFQANAAAIDFSVDAQYVRCTDVNRTTLSIRTLFAIAPVIPDPVEAAAEPEQPVEGAEEDLDEEGNLFNDSYMYRYICTHLHE